MRSDLYWEDLVVDRYFLSRQSRASQYISLVVDSRRTHSSGGKIDSSHLLCPASPFHLFSLPC